MKNPKDQKAKHGSNAKKSLEKLLQYCKKQNYILDYQGEYRIGKKGFSNSEQFYAAFIVRFADEEWILYSTTTMRSDRVKGQQWDSLQLKEINSSIKKSYLVYPDEVKKKDKEDFIRQNEKYLSGYEYSVIDGIINQEEFYNMVESKATGHLNVGQVKDIQGRNFEDRVAEILSSKENIKKWKSSDQSLVGLHFHIFDTIASELQLKSGEVQEIIATANKKEIGVLPTGGSPKTDVIVLANLNNGEQNEYSISCKRTSKKGVSVHEYAAEKFSRVLDGENDELRKLLVKFQETPTLSGFGEENGERLTKELSTYNKKLALWVLGGIGGDGDPGTQWASHLLAYDNNNNNISIHSIERYYELLKSKNIKGNFGTFFSWTYPSKRRGKSIQLKCKMIQD